MSERAYHITHTAVIDPQTSTALQSAYNMDDDASYESLEARAALLDRVVWARVAAQNARKWVMGEVLAHERETRRKAYAAVGKRTRNAQESDRLDENTVQMHLEAMIRAGAKLDGKDPEAVMQTLRDEVAEHTKAA
jgi:acyl-homoserine lactone acylase PvdQ